MNVMGRSKIIFCACLVVSLAWTIWTNFYVIAVYPFWFLNWTMGGKKCSMRGGFCAELMRPSRAFIEDLGLTPSFACSSFERWGAAGDGGWDICVAEAVKGPKLGLPCVVYSVGGNLEWSFELAALKRNCEVHTFDPTIHVPAAGTKKNASCTKRSRCGRAPDPRIHYHNFGMFGAELQLPNVGSVKRLSSIMDELGHTSVQLLKVDIEGSEWPWLLSLDAREIQRVEQLVVEIHLQPRTFPAVMNAMPFQVRHAWWGAAGQQLTTGHAYPFYISKLHELTSTCGFEVARVHQNLNSSIELVGPWPVVSCYEITYVRVQKG